MMYNNLELRDTDKVTPLHLLARGVGSPDKLAAVCSTDLAVTLEPEDILQIIKETKDFEQTGVLDKNLARVCEQNEGEDDE